MNLNNPSTARTIFAWMVGISMWLFSFMLIISLLNIHGLHGSFAEYAIVVPCCMIGGRAGMAIRIGKLNGGVSQKGNILFVRWMIFFIMVGSIGTVAQIFMDMAFDKKLWLKAIAIALLVNGAGVMLLVRLRLVDNDTE